MSQRAVALDHLGQITILAAMRRALGLREGNTVGVRLAIGQIHVTPHGSVTTRTSRLLDGAGPVLTAVEPRDAAAQAIADEDIESMGPPGPDFRP